MKYNELTISKNRKKNRLGRGISAGQGKTAGRGTKGQKARAGSSKRPGFEGGQNPLMQRLPKLRGFTSKKAVTENIYTAQLNTLGVNIDNNVLAKAGLISSPYVKVKLISKGELKSKVSVHVQAASESAIKAIEKQKGSFVKTAQLKRPAKKSSDK